MHIYFIVDLQFGSTGKGALAGYLAENRAPDTVVSSWGPNAGHTYVGRDGVPHVHIMLPNGVESPRLKRIMIGPGSVLRPDLLEAEIAAYGGLKHAQLLIHERAAVVADRHRELEAVYGHRIGSTMKGTAEAMIEKLRRDPNDGITAAMALRGTNLEGCVVDHHTWIRAMEASDLVQVEGAQGYSLGINSGFYPYTTSRECTVGQLLTDCAIPMGQITDHEVIGVARTYPIRVANRFRDGVQIGWSGPCYPDQREMEWSELGREAELTTVTKLPRRIFTFSMEQIKEAVAMNAVDRIFLNFCNYLPEAPMAMDLAKKIGAETPASVSWFGWGPKVTDIQEWA